MGRTKGRVPCAGPRPFLFEIMGGVVKRGWCHVPISLTQGPVPPMDGCPTFLCCGRTGAQGPITIFVNLRLSLVSN